MCLPLLRNDGARRFEMDAHTAVETLGLSYMKVGRATLELSCACIAYGQRGG